jgi:hypothetical protein
MTIRKNEIKPQVLAVHEVDFGTSIARAIFAKIADFHNWTESSIPIGYLLYFYASQINTDGSMIEKPNENLWVLCDGRLIEDPESPLDGTHSPDLRKLYLKGGDEIGLTGGQTTINLSHNHTSRLAFENDESSGRGATGGSDHRAGSNHTHTVASRWPTAEPIIPPTIEIQIYMRKK